MKTIVAGPRGIDNFEIVKEAIEKSQFEITEIISGCARGVDTLGEQYAEQNNISVKKFPAEWSIRGRAAGVIRNREMGEYADALIAIWDGESRGTKNMIDIAEKKKLKIFIYNIK